MAETEEISLRPISLRPAALGGNPFSGFGKGSGYGIKGAKQPVIPTEDPDAKAKRSENKITYATDFLMMFMERYTTCPPELLQLNMEIVISGQEEKELQRQVLQKVAEDLDDRDWRTRTPLAAPLPALKERPQQRQFSQETYQPSEQNGTTFSRPQPVVQEEKENVYQPSQSSLSAEALKIQRASDVGKEAFKFGSAVSQEERAVRQIKGILNKLTPEKFERLLDQILGIVTTADILQQTITMLFENAVAQPTFVAMYADLCVRLSKELPQFPPPEGSDKPLAFKQILLNTCQDEFEGAEEARANLANTDPTEKEAAEKRVKDRTMGTVRLIAELYKQDMLKDWAILTCMEELLGKAKSKQLPPEDNIEAACEILTLAGGKISKADRPDAKKKVEEVMKMFERLSGERGLASRIRFLIKDVLDLKRANWVARREAFTAKKLEEIRGAAEAELGMIPSTINAALPALPTLERNGNEEFMLLPPLRLGEEVWGSRSGGGAFEGGSALIGDYVPPTAPSAPTVVPVVAVTAPVTQSTETDEEDLARKTESLLAEYESTGDASEALTCVRELSSPNWMPQLVKLTLDRLANALKEREQELLGKLLLFLHSKEAISTEDLLSGLGEITGQLEEVAIDAPRAPSLLGNFYGKAIAQKALTLELLPDILAGDYSALPKRVFGAAALKVLKEKAGESAFGPLCERAGIKASAVFTHDPSLDGDMPSVEDWLKQEGLSEVPA